ncbi:hypothetical protein, partial [Klebsiella quasipneumoniae]
IRAALGSPTPDRLLKVAQALRLGFSPQDIHASFPIDPWFIEQLQIILSAEASIRANGLPKTAHGMRRVKALGFSDARLAELAGVSEEDM